MPKLLNIAKLCISKYVHICILLLFEHQFKSDKNFDPLLPPHQKLTLIKLEQDIILCTIVGYNNIHVQIQQVIWTFWTFTGQSGHNMFSVHSRRLLDNTYVFWTFQTFSGPMLSVHFRRFLDICYLYILEIFWTYFICTFRHFLDIICYLEILD